MASTKARLLKHDVPVHGLFRLFSLVFDRFCTFLLVFALFGQSVSERVGPSVFAVLRTIRLLPCSGRHLDAPERRSVYDSLFQCALPAANRSRLR